MKLSLKRMFTGTVSYFSTVYLELAKVIWPNRQKVLRDAVVVIISIGITVLMFSGWDLLLQRLLRVIIAS